MRDYQGPQHFHGGILASPMLRNMLMEQLREWFSVAGVVPNDSDAPEFWSKRGTDLDSRTCLLGDSHSQTIATSGEKWKPVGTEFYG